MCGASTGRPTARTFAASAMVGSVAVLQFVVRQGRANAGGPRGTFYVVRWSPDGTKLACGGTVNTTIYDVRRAKS